MPNTAVRLRIARARGVARGRVRRGARDARGVTRRGSRVTVRDVTSRHNVANFVFFFNLYLAVTVSIKITAPKLLRI